MNSCGVEHRWNNSGKGNPTYSGEAFPNITLFTEALRGLTWDWKWEFSARFRRLPAWPMVGTETIAEGTFSEGAFGNYIDLFGHKFVFEMMFHIWYSPIATDSESAWDKFNNQWRSVMTYSGTGRRTISAAPHLAVGLLVRIHWTMKKPAVMSLFSGVFWMSDVTSVRIDFLFLWQWKSFSFLFCF